MSKLQRTVRNNGSVITSVNIPKEVIEKMDWKKGARLIVTACNESSGEYIKIEKEVE